MDEVTLKPFNLHDAISCYLGWTPYDRKPIVATVESPIMSAEEYEKEFGVPKF